MNRKVLLIEPNYKNKYPPMGLMKLATYYREQGDDVQFFKGDLKYLAAKLLCEEFIVENNAYSYGKYMPNFIEFIRTGKFSSLDMIPKFKGSQLDLALKNYRTRFRRDDYVKFDIIAITTLFTFYWQKTIDTINYSKKFIKCQGRIIVGGIAATILSDEIYNATGIKPFCGLLNKPSMLDPDSDSIIDELPLDYSILEEIDYRYPANNAYFSYMTRGCPRKCAFCAVPRLEPEYSNYINLKKHISLTTERFGPQKDLLLMDNNVFASNQFNKIIDEIKECGFERGAKYLPESEYNIALKNLNDGYNIRGYKRKIIKLYDTLSDKLSETEQADFFIEREVRNLLYPEVASIQSIIEFDSYVRPLYEKHFKLGKRMRVVDFNQGVDARLVTEDKIKKLSEINIRPLRIAFDHYSMKDVYENAVRLSAQYNITNLSNYLLYNFNDKPEDLYYRMKINIDLCNELDVTIYSFPMKYHPIDDPKYFHNRDYIGPFWNKKFIRAIQSVLNSTKGKIGRGQTFFEEAFGANIDEFFKILWMPEKFIIHRFQYKDNLTAEWWYKFNQLSEVQLITLKSIVSHNKFKEYTKSTDDHAIIEVLNYYQ